MKTMLLLIISFIGLTTFNSCEKITNTTWVYYDETYCADPWGGTNIEDSEKIKNIEKYLKKQKIKVFEVIIISDGMMEPCDACNCKTGKRIKCKVKENDVEGMKNEKFYQ